MIGVHTRIDSFWCRLVWVSVVYFFVRRILQREHRGGRYEILGLMIQHQYGFYCAFEGTRSFLESFVICEASSLPRFGFCPQSKFQDATAYLKQ